VQFACDIDDMTGEELGAAESTGCARWEGGVGSADAQAGGQESRPVTRLEVVGAASGSRCGHGGLLI